MKTARRHDGRTASSLAATAATFAILLGVLPPCRLAAQSSAPQLIDRIVAIVGDKALLLSDVDERIAEARSQGLQVPEDTTQLATLRHQVLFSMIDEELIYQEAKRDTSVVVTDAEVQAAVDEQVRSVRGQFHTDAEFRTALQRGGLGTLDEYRRFLAEQSRRSSYQRRYIDHLRQEGKLHAGTVSEAEMRAFFEDARAKGQVGRVPASITFKQIVVSPRPSVAAKAAAFQRADSIRVAIERGADFAAMARQFSSDPTTKANGGDLGWFRRGQMVRQFEVTAFNLRPGTPSPVVETEYGFHVILVDRVQTGQVKARHILIAPAITDSERVEARRIADSVVVLLRGGVSADSLARLYGDSGETVNVGPADRAQLPPGYSQALASAQAGQLVGPVALNPETPERPRLLIALVTDAQPEHEPSFEDKREEVRSAMLDQKGIRNLVESLKRRTFVDVRL